MRYFITCGVGLALVACSETGNGGAEGVDTLGNVSATDGPMGDMMVGQGGAAADPIVTATDPTVDPGVDPGLEAMDSMVADDCDNSLSPYAGDCYALEPPDPSVGFQLHYGPENYTEAEMSRFLLGPGEEIVDCLFMTTPNDQDIYFQAYDVTIRHGTHHTIIWLGGQGAADGTLLGCEGDGGPGSAWMIAAQGALSKDGNRVSFPGTTELAPEDLGSARVIPAGSKIAYQVHFVNVTDEPILRESWTNIYYKPATEVDTIIDTVAWIGGLGMNVAPGTTEITTASCGAALGGERRIVSMVGHMHAHGERFTAWKVDAAGTRMKIYETFQWEEPDYLVFNSVVQNPEPDTALRIGGGYSGVLTLGRGERIDYECEINNTTDAPLRWANEAYSAEMCNLIGTYSPAVGTWGCQNN